MNFAKRDEKGDGKMPKWKSKAGKKKGGKEWGARAQIFA